MDLGQQCSKSTIGLVPVLVFGPSLDRHPFESTTQASLVTRFDGWSQSGSGS